MADTISTGLKIVDRGNATQLDHAAPTARREDIAIGTKDAGGQAFPFAEVGGKSVEMAPGLIVSGAGNRPDCEFPSRSGQY